jgi:glycosyltransferase involved in cell wall biosynthesis
MTFVKFVVPTVPWYRVDFFERLRVRFPDLTVHSSQVELAGFENPETGSWLHDIGSIRKLPLGAFWQGGTREIEISSGDVIIVTGEPRVLSLPLLLLRARRRNAHTIWWGHYWGATSRGWRLLVRSFVMNMCDAIAVYNDSERYAAQTNPLISRSVKIIGMNNGVPRDAVAGHRRPYSAASRERRIVFLGRLTAKSELPLLLEALGHADLQEVRLDVVGSGEEQAELERLAARIGVADRIVWHGALSDEARIAEVANRARMFVYPGAVGLSLLHAMSYGLPAAVHDNFREHMPEISAFVPHVTGVTFAQRRAASLARAVGSYIEDVDALDAASATSLVLAEQYGTDVMAARMGHLIAELTSDHAPLERSSSFAGSLDR